MDKSIVVETTRTYRHPKYGKYVCKQKRYLVHDPENSAKRGDMVEIAATRPLSKHKRWRLVRIVDRADAPLDSAVVPDGSRTDIVSEGGES
jgi:small subunit ribosomal protein S17